MEQTPHKDLAIQKHRVLCSVGTSMDKAQRVDHGIQHNYTCWPKDMSDQGTLVKWIKRTEKNDAYLQTTLCAGQRAEAVILENVSLGNTC